MQTTKMMNRLLNLLLILIVLLLIQIIDSSSHHHHHQMSLLQTSGENFDNENIKNEIILNKQIDDDDNKKNDDDNKLDDDSTSKKPTMMRTKDSRSKPKHYYLRRHHRRQLVVDKNNNNNIKPCKYSSDEQKELDKFVNKFKQQQQQLDKDDDEKENLIFYLNSNNNNSSQQVYNSKQIKQPKTRQQSYSRYYNDHYLSSQNDDNDIDNGEPFQVDIYAEIGETVNFTCNINAREIDWHFTDRNGSTTILSNGLMLIVQQPLIYDFSNIGSIYSKSSSSSASSSASARIAKHHGRPKHHNNNYYNDNNDIDVESEYQLNDDEITNANQKKILKYRLNSDFKSKHMLSLYVQGVQDVGAYQCVDSRSESPIKKKISLILSKKKLLLLFLKFYKKKSFSFYLNVCF